MPRYAARGRRRPVYKRRRTTKRVAKRRTYKRRSIANRTHQYLMRSSFYVDQTTSIQTQWLTPYLSQCSDYQRYTGLYDEYKITKIRVEVIPSSTMNDAGQLVTLTANPPGSQYFNVRDNIESVLDYNSNPGLTTTSDLNDYGSYKWTRANRVHSRTFYPRIQTPVWRGSASANGYYAEKPKWLSTAYLDVPHFGMFVKLPAFPLASTVRWFFKVTRWVTFRHIDAANADSGDLNTTASDPDLNQVDGQDYNAGVPGNENVDPVPVD